jgi:tRNA pseudouridine38-40 synthase
MQAAAKHLVGRHDFAPFAANRGSPVEDTVRLLSHARVARAGRLITIELEADGFLYKMVRLIVGSLAQVGAGTVGPQEIRDRLRDPQLSFGSNRNAAPASGLFLIRVRY